MFILAVDTNSLSGSVAVLKDTQLLAEVNIRTQITHSERLLPAIQFMLETAKLTIADMDGFALAVGPGSFTGIRIGMSTVKSFAHVYGKSIAPVSNLSALALKLKYPQARLLCPILDAKKNEIYAALFEIQKRQWKENIAQGVYKPDKFFSMLPENRVISFIGSGVDLYRENIFQYIKDKARFSTRSHFIAHEVGLLGYEMLRAGQGLDSHGIEPLYFRKSQAEEKHQ